MTDTERDIEIAERIRKHLCDLNIALADASSAGLYVDIDYSTNHNIGHRFPQKLYGASVERRTIIRPIMPTSQNDGR